jgi:hypothetical protein
MRSRMYGGVRGRKMKVGRKLSLSSYSIWGEVKGIQDMKVRRAITGNASFLASFY